MSKYTSSNEREAPYKIESVALALVLSPLEGAVDIVGVGAALVLSVQSTSLFQVALQLQKILSSKAAVPPNISSP
mgnify:CR=1 FL=1